MLLGIILLSLTLGISWLNCYVCGKMWNEAKIGGGFMRVLVWCGAMQSAFGFSCILILALMGIATSTGLLLPEDLKGVYSLWYLLVIIPVIGSGDWRERRGCASGGCTGCSHQNYYLCTLWSEIGRASCRERV